MHEKQRRRLAQRIRQLGDGGKRGGRALALLDLAFRPRLVARDVMGVRQRLRRRLLPPQHAEGVMAHDTPEPAGKCRRVGKRRKRGPRRDERLLDHVLRPLEVTHQRQRRPEGGVLEATHQLHERSHVAGGGQADQMFMRRGFMRHRRILAHKVPGNGDGL